MEATPRNRRDKQGEHGNLYLIVPQGRLHSEKDWLSPETNPGWGPQGHPGFQQENTQDWAHWSSGLRSITARGCEAEPAMGEGPVGEGWGPGETGPSFQNPVPRTHTDPQRHMCSGKLVTDSEPGFLLVGRPCGPLCWEDTQSSPRAEGVSTDRAQRHREPPSVGVLGALPTPQLLDASPAHGPLGGQQSGSLGGPLSSKNPLKLTSKSNTLSKLYCEDPRYNRKCFFKECMFFKQLF